MDIITGIDIGGTKCAISFGEYINGSIKILDKVVLLTDPDFEKIMGQFIEKIKKNLKGHPEWNMKAIGISCGGPLDSEKGLILAPPNLPTWDGVDCFTPLKDSFHVPVAIENDANACALAEWKWGAGKGSSNMIFLTFGTGMGAGLILNNRLYRGSTNMAGEVGHIRLENDGPDGYGKNGSFEGFCSGGGIANLGRIEAEKALAAGAPPLFCKTIDDLGDITAQSIGCALEQGDALARDIYLTSGKYLGKGISILIDILNPEVIVIGSIFGRQRQVLEPKMQEVIEKEALEPSAKVCRIVSAGLGEMVGDYAALSVGVESYLSALKK